jgi:hypothetical protein
MPSRRMIDPSFWKSESLAGLTVSQRQAQAVQVTETSIAQSANAAATANAQAVWLIQAQSTATAASYQIDGQATRQAAESAAIDARADRATLRGLGIIAIMLAMIFACYSLAIVHSARRNVPQSAIVDQSIKSEWVSDGASSPWALPPVRVVNDPRYAEVVEMVVEMEAAQ